VRPHLVSVTLTFESMTLKN